jgi:signal transduction histidine kinase
MDLQVNMQYRILTCLMILLAGCIIHKSGHAQSKQMIQVKIFDQQLKPLPAMELRLNNTISVVVNEKGSAFVELPDMDTPIQLIELKDQKWEVASWNFSKGVVEILARQRNYQIVTVQMVDTEQNPISQKEVVFSGSRRIRVRSGATGKVELPLKTDERIVSPNQFAMEGYQSIRLNTTPEMIQLVMDEIQEKIPSPSPPVISTTPNYSQQMTLLDTIRTLSSFYQWMKELSMEDLTDEQKQQVDAKFNMLIRQIQQSATPTTDNSFAITDSTEVTDDVKKLIKRAEEEGEELNNQKLEFDRQIAALNIKLSKGIVNLDDNMRSRLLEDILMLEKLLMENRARFDRNQSEYRQVISSLKERYLNIQDLETKLTESEQLRLEQEKVFRQQLLFGVVLFILLCIIILILVRFGSRQRKQRKALQDANNEIKLINENLEDIVTERTRLLREANKELDTFLYRASHDLRTPVASIIGICNIASYIEPRELLEKITSSTDRMDKLLKHLSVISQINSPSNESQVSLVQVLNTLKQKLKLLLESNKIFLSIHGNENVSLKTYPLLLETVLTNVIENAVHFVTLGESAEPWVEITVTTHGSHCEIMVEDNGVGIEQTVLPHIYDMFYKGNTQSKGSGLGLYIVSRCLSVMKGTIQAESTSGQYTRFTISLPSSLSVQPEDSKKDLEKPSNVVLG